jgi:hypothetical protein
MPWRSPRYDCRADHVRVRISVDCEPVNQQRRVVRQRGSAWELQASQGADERVQIGAMRSDRSISSPLPLPQPDREPRQQPLTDSGADLLRIIQLGQQLLLRPANRPVVEQHPSSNERAGHRCAAGFVDASD